MLGSPNCFNAHTLKLLDNAALPNHVDLLIKLLAFQVGSRGISCSIYFLLHVTIPFTPGHLISCNENH